MSSDLLNEFHLPLSERAYAEFRELKLWLTGVQLSQGNDIWSCPRGTFKAATYYTHVHRSIVVCPLYKWIWKSKCTMKIKMFTWLMISDRLNTRDLLQRRHWKVTEDFTCVLCPGRVHEDRDHLFFSCNFSVRIWNYLQIKWPQLDDLLQVAMTTRKDFAQPFFTEVVFLACWSIWKVRNDKIFNNINPKFAT